MKKKHESIRIIDLESAKARSYFLKSENYCNFDLPLYFDFKKMLWNISKSGCINNSCNANRKSPCTSSCVNYTLLTNKDGRYAWRPLQLINPVIYVQLVHTITCEPNWKHIQERFQHFSEDKEKIECWSIPVQSQSKESDKAERVSNWWQGIEQRSIELALDYSCLTHTDLTDCYGSIYTHSIAWALHGKDKAKAQRRCKKLIGNQIDCYLQAMSDGQTNGIPQGSVLMDFIAEMLLGYIDCVLIQRLKDLLHEESFKILRFRDDYRIFSNSGNTNETIIKNLSETLADFGLKLSPEKTNIASNLISSSLKKDKLFSLGDLSLLKMRLTEEPLQKTLLVIHDLSIRFPNSGSLNKALNRFYKTIDKRKYLTENIYPLISIAVDIAIRNPRTYSIITAIVSVLFEFECNKSEREKTIKIIIKKFECIPNTGYLQVWLQRMTLSSKIKHLFEEPLCKLINNDREVSLYKFSNKNKSECENEKVSIWDMSWANDSMKKVLRKQDIIDYDKKKSLPSTITKEEVELFKGTDFDY